MVDGELARTIGSPVALRAVEVLIFNIGYTITLVEREKVPYFQTQGF